jgi:xylulokinase
VRGVAEAQMLALARHSRWMGVDTRTIYATGGASANRDILQVMADVFGADVYQFPVGNSACLGAALRALHADRLDCGLDADWQDVVRGFAEPLASSVVRADPGRHALYREMSAVHAACEAHALGQGPDPAEARASFRSRFPVP